MDKFKQMIKKYLRERLDNSTYERTKDCPSEVLLSDYLQNRLPRIKKEDIERHIADCPICLETLLVTKDIFKRNNVHSRISRVLRYKWLIASAVSMSLSFFLPRYFLQFLITSLILGLKWALEGEGARNLVMVFRSLHKEEKEVPLRKKI